jgi:hypothetical protein
MSPSRGIELSNWSLLSRTARSSCHAEYNRAKIIITEHPGCTGATGYTPLSRALRTPRRNPSAARRPPPTLAALPLLTVASGLRPRTRHCPEAVAYGGFTSIRRHLASSSISRVNPSPCIGQRIESADTVAVLCWTRCSLVSLWS